MALPLVFANLRRKLDKSRPLAALDDLPVGELRRLTVDLGVEDVGSVSGTAAVLPGFRILVADELDFDATVGELTRWYAELPPLLRLDHVDLVVVSSCEGEFVDVGGRALMRRRGVLLSHLSNADAATRRYVFEHEMAHMLLNSSTLLKAVFSAAVVVSWRQVCQADRRSELRAGLRGSGVDVLCLPVPVSETEVVELCLNLAADTVTSYADENEEGGRFIEDLAESLALYLMDARLGGLPIAEGLTRSDSERVALTTTIDGQAAGVPFAALFPNRARVLAAVCAFKPEADHSPERALAKALRPLFEESKRLRKGLPLPA